MLHLSDMKNTSSSCGTSFHFRKPGLDGATTVIARRPDGDAIFTDDGTPAPGDSLLGLFIQPGALLGGAEDSSVPERGFKLRVDFICSGPNPIPLAQNKSKHDPQWTKSQVS